MKNFFLIVIQLLALDMFGQNSKGAEEYLKNTFNTDLTCAANYFKKDGAINDEDYEKITKNDGVHHFRINMTLDKKDIYWHFFDSGSSFMERVDGNFKINDGQWGCLNIGNLKAYLPSTTKKNEVLYFNSETGEMSTKKPIDLKTQINSKKPNEGEYSGWTRTAPVDGEYDDFIVKEPQKKYNPQSTPSNTISGLLSQIDPNKIGSQIAGMMRDEINGKKINPKNCNFCDGRGVVKTCPHCQRKGIEYCRNCNGYKVTRDGMTCLNCSGKGYVVCHVCKGRKVNFRCTHRISQFM